MRELLSRYDFPGDDIPVIKGSATQALMSEEFTREDPAHKPLWELMDAVDSYIPTPERDKDKPFLMPIEDVFTITGRGTVVTGRVERGTLKINEPVEIVGMRPTRKTIATSLEQFHKVCDIIYAGDNAGVLLRGVNRTDVERGQVVVKPGTSSRTRSSRARSTS